MIQTFTLYVQKSGSWTFEGDFTNRHELYKACIHWQNQGFKTDFSAPGDRVELDFYD